MHLQWDSGYSGNTVILYNLANSQTWLENTADCYTNNIISTGSRECQAILNVTPGAIYYYKFREGDITQEFSYSYFVVPTELKESDITISNTTGRSVTFTWQTDKVTKGKIIYYPADNSMDQNRVEEGGFVNGHSITLNDLFPNRKYLYQIISLDQEGAGVTTSWSNMLSFTTIDADRIKNGDGTYDLYEGDMVKLNSGTVVEPVFLSSNDIFYVKFKVYVNETNYQGTTEAVTAGLNKKLLHVYHVGSAKFEVQIDQLGKVGGKWHTKVTFWSTPNKPVIDSIKPIANSNSATISWLVDSPTVNCAMPYGKSSDLNNSTTVFGKKQTQETVYNYRYDASLSNLESGTKYYYKIICSESESNYSESEILNFHTSLGQIDLTVKDIFYENGLIKVKYCNAGTTSNKNSFGVGETFYIKMITNGKTHTGTSNSSNYVLSTPDPGECASSDGYPASYFNLTSGSSSVTAEIDWQKVVNESNENNNTLTKTVTIGGSDDTGFLYNIMATSITKNSATIKWTTSRAANSQVEYVESGGSIYDIKGKKDIGYVTEHNVTLADLKPGTLYKYALTSYDQQGNVYGTSSLSSSVLGLHFTTLSESNQLKPDLVPIQLEVKNLTRPGNKIFKQNDIVEVKISFKNVGETDINQEFFYTVEKDIGFGRLRGNVLNLKAGETYKYTSKMLWPKDIGSGEVNFMFTVDSDNNIDESNEDNNILFKKITLGKATPIPPTPTPPLTPTPLPIPSPPSGKIAERLVGRLLLAVEDKGRIHYVNPDDQKRYEVTFGNVMSLFQNLALGISNADLNQILINPSSVSEGKDTDGDGFNDKSEVMYGYNPEIASSPANRGNDKIKVNTKLSDRLIGKLLLQTEDRGRIWYVDQGAKRWEVTFGNVINLFTSLALGITNQDLTEIETGN
ncbi:hypothetical protein A3H03_01750 [Candidatus Kuenenbacteria bacterium RIFCSPLOWO2_12_FULL_42_13]|uniref:Fibronectin type-III domain-containing protein n=1 Tax=Candidatus Kuenenbacteria bacterium RIFCSPLOWO2_12_FULL_42_13 TaxID=1798565 RepID=A0A1F6FZI1_9BACT|nr:MAG: hypothetical protein A3H03_01750 [Candidatus Kuenenbacteria bacterium RIFCSPLOWO2_12_FULL_42_13]